MKRSIKISVESQDERVLNAVADSMLKMASRQALSHNMLSDSISGQSKTAVKVIVSEYME